jgi:hypothetical protein
MNTSIILTRTNPTDHTKTFYFVNIYYKDQLGFTHSQYSSMITFDQYESLIGDRKEVYQSEPNLYFVKLI